MVIVTSIHKNYQLATLTGICHVLNGNSVHNTFVSGGRVDVFQENLDARQNEVIPDTIEGTGKLARKTFWLNIGERYEHIVNISWYL